MTDYIIFHAYYAGETKEDGWTWIKFPAIPPEETRLAIKNIDFRFSRKKTRKAWYCTRYVSKGEIEKLIGPTIGVVDGRGPTSTWRYCMEIVQMSMSLGDAVTQPEPPKVEKKSKPKPKGNTKFAARLRGWADGLQKQIDDKRSGFTQNPTPRRLFQDAGKRHDANDLERAQQAMYALADLHESGECPPELQGLKYKKDIVPLLRTRSDTSGYYSYVETGEFCHDAPDALMLQDLISLSPEERAEQERLRELERMDRDIFQMIRQIPGFFPTPEKTAHQLIDHIYIYGEMTILEPGAGSGALADILRDDYPMARVTCVEIAPRLCRILELKGHSPIEADFLTWEPDHLFDRVVMNPPFENGGAMKHIKRAYGCLEENGRLASIVPLQSQDQWRVEELLTEKFKDWLNDKNWSLLVLPPDAFKESQVNIQTGILVIEK